MNFDFYISFMEPPFVVAKIIGLGLPGSIAGNNFVREGPVNDVLSHWRLLETESDSYLRLFQACPTQMAYWVKKYVSVLTRSAH